MIVTSDKDIVALVPSRTGRNAPPGFGALGFPWLFVGNIIVGAANAGWSYYRTKQQVQSAMRESGAAPPSNADVNMVADQMQESLGIGAGAAKKYARDMMSASPTTVQGVSPAEFVAMQQRLEQLEQRGASRAGMGLGNIPTWGYIALAAGAFLVAKQMKVI
ncbi:MAG: hypothetical protein ACYS1A_18105 [Planctomycetota bacterium]